MAKDISGWVNLRATVSEFRAIQNVVFGMTSSDDRERLARLVERTKTPIQRKPQSDWRPWVAYPAAVVASLGLSAGVLFLGSLAQDTLYEKTGIAVHIINVPGIGNVPFDVPKRATAPAENNEAVKEPVRVDRALRVPFVTPGR